MSSKAASGVKTTSMSFDQVTFPTRCAFRCGGISMIVSQILFLVAWILHAPSYDVFDVDSEAEVRELHAVLSSPEHRVKTEITCACMWLSFPLLLCALYTLRGMISKLVQNSNAEMLVYLMEKSFIIYLTIMYIILPASALVSVSYNWDFYEYTPDDKQIPTGYYIQLYIIILQFELIDCCAIADATFLISIFAAIRFMLYGSQHNNQKFLQFRDIMAPPWFKNKPNFVVFLEIISCCCLITLFIIFAIILFEFAESGFFSPFGHAKFLTIVVIFVKIMLGIRLCWASSKERYEKFINLWAKHENDGVCGGSLHVHDHGHSHNNNNNNNNSHRHSHDGSSSPRIYQHKKKTKVSTTDDIDDNEIR